jgi:Outer membrane protein beta-barrel family/Carboxypeptidase regulatory-like domain
MKYCHLRISAVLLCCFYTCSNLFAQYTINGNIVNADFKPVANANALLLHPKDSSLFKGTISNASGTFSFQNITAGKYLISCSYTGFITTYTLEIAVPSKGIIIDAGTVVLKPETSQLNTVTVTGKRPMFEQKIDRMIINVKNSITSTGGTVLDVLEKSPGVIVNKQAASISMNGKDGIRVMINSKMSYMPADAIIQMLDGMNATNVDRIELITTPPAKYDAEGNAGYINIVLLNNPDVGFNGSYAITAAAFVGSEPSANFNFNYRKKKVNLYGGYTFSRLAQKQVFTNYRKVTYQGKTTETSTSSDRDPVQLNHGLRLGIDYQLSKKTVLGLLVSGYNNKWTMDAVNSIYTKLNGTADTSIKVINDEINHWKHLMGNVNLQHSFASGDELTINADYLRYKDSNPTNYSNIYYKGGVNPVRNESTRSGKETIITIVPVQLDYKKKINSKLEFETGAKAVFSKFTNDVRIETQMQNIWKPDSSLTANYFLNENIGAGYASLSIIASEKTSIKAGLRYEYTSSNLATETVKNIVDRKYGNLFPTLYLSHKLNDNNSFNFSYNRRINRPTFNNLAPFVIFLDPTTFISGNAALQPSIADAVKVDYLFKKFVFSAGYTYEANSIAGFQTEVNAATNQQYIIARNLTNTHSVFGSVSLPVSIAKWWFSQINLVSTWQKVNADYKQKPLSITQFDYNISGFQSFTLPNDYAIELSGFFQSPSLFGASPSKAFGALNAGVQKKFPNSSSTLRLGVDNIFNSLAYKVTFDVPSENFYTNGSYLFSRRMFKLTWTQNFGNKILKDKRNRITASEAERKRVQ